MYGLGQILKTARNAWTADSRNAMAKVIENRRKVDARLEADMRVRSDLIAAKLPAIGRYSRSIFDAVEAFTSPASLYQIVEVLHQSSIEEDYPPTKVKQYLRLLNVNGLVNIHKADDAGESETRYSIALNADEVARFRAVDNERALESAHK